MITKQSFTAILRAIEKQYERDENNGDLITQLADPEFQYYKVIFTTPIISDLMNILKSEMQCEDSEYVGDDISYWVYELEFGKKDSEMGLWENNKKVNLETPEDLYDYLTSSIIE